MDIPYVGVTHLLIPVDGRMRVVGGPSRTPELRRRFVSVRL